MRKKIRKMLKQKWTWLKEVVKYRNLAFKHGRDLSIRQNNLKKIKPNDILLVAVMKNEAHRLKYFLDYYRRLGVDHFIFVDNDSTDHFTTAIEGQSDVTAFFTSAGYKASNFGMHWANYLLYKYGSGHWCVTCDPDEFLVYPFIETRGLRDLTEYLSSIREPAFFTTMIDMYGEKAVEDSFYTEGTDPVNACAYFDSTGYVKAYSKEYKNLFVQGGVRRRVFFKDNPGDAPALNKVPLVKWRRHYFYVSSMHMAIPRKLNEGYFSRKTSGAILHYKFISQLKDKVAEEIAAKQHYNDSAEYKKYNRIIQEKSHLYDPSVSVKYESWRTLAKLGLVNVGEW